MTTPKAKARAKAVKVPIVVWLTAMAVWARVKVVWARLLLRLAGPGSGSNQVRVRAWVKSTHVYKCYNMRGRTCYNNSRIRSRLCEAVQVM